MHLFNSNCQQFNTDKKRSIYFYFAFTFSIYMQFSRNLVGFMVFNTTYRGGGNRRTLRKPPTCHKLDHIMLYTPPIGIRLITSAVIGTDCIGSCKSNYHTITATMAPTFYELPIHKKMSILLLKSSYPK